MIIEENQFRPPSPREMQARYVSLERIHIEWQPKCWEELTLPPGHDTHECACPATLGWAYVVDAGFTTLELIEFHKEHVIPYEAFLVNDGYEGEKALDWTHLVQCKVCQQWYGKGTDHANDTLHMAVEAGTARAPEESA